MPGQVSALVRCTLLGAVLTLPACQRSPDEDQLATLDNQITGNQADPALTSALADPILTDPALSQQSNRNAVRTPGGPAQAQYPPGSGSRVAARRQAEAPVRTASAGHQGMRRVASGETTVCNGATLDHGVEWARRLPATFPLPAGARVTEAAGVDKGDCRYRVVTFASDAPPDRVLDWYRQRAAAAGYSVEHQREAGDHVLAGAKESDGGAYYLIVTPRGPSGSDVALIANNGA